jgi:uncharacterized protein YhaN
VKIKRLDIKAFGNFTDLTIDLSSELPGLHIIYGPNEAGKSTALRALRSFLYGIDARTPDNFLHEYSKLMIGGHIESAKGESLVCWRRKRNVGDLLGKDMSPLDDATLNEFLGGVGENLFDSLFGINHETLISGGKDILEQKGDVGQALFSAGVGLSSLHGIIEALDRECADLFKAGGSKPEINRTTKHIQALKKELRELSLPSSKWKEQKELFKTASDQLVKAEEERNKCLTALERLKRLQRAMPHLSRRRDMLEKINALGSLDYLREDFLESLAEARNDIREFDKRLRTAESLKESLAAKVADCDGRQEVLDQAETIEALHQRLGTQLQAKKDKPGVHDQMIRCKTKAATLLNQVLPGLNIASINEIKPFIDERQDILKLGNQYAGLKKSLNQAEKQVKDLTALLKKVTVDLETLPEYEEISGVAAAVRSARKPGDIDQHIRDLDVEIENYQASIEAETRQLFPWDGQIKDLPSLPIPSLVTVNKVADDIRDASDATRTVEEDLRKTQEDLDRITSELREMERVGVVPTVEELDHARDSRDKLWQIVRRNWLEQEDVAEELRNLGLSKELPEAYEERVKNADDISDHLRTEAQRVHKYAHLSAQAETLVEHSKQLQKSGDRAAERLVQIETSWQEIWRDCGMTPLSPAEMRGWVERCQDIQRMLKEQLAKMKHKQSLVDQRQGLLELLASELKDIGQDKVFRGADIEPVIAYAEEIHEKLKGSNDQRRSLEKEISRIKRDIEPAKNELETSTSAMDNWRKRWKEPMEGIGLHEDTSPEMAVEALDNLRDCLEQLEKAEEYTQRLEAMDKFTDEFSEDVLGLVKSVAPEIKDLPPEQAVAKLQSMLKEARHLATRRDGFIENMDAAQEDIRLATVELDRATRKIDELKRSARCETDEQLEAVEKKYREFLDLVRKRDQVEEMLAGIAEGVPIEDLDRQTQNIDANALPGDIESLERRLKEELDPLLQELSEDKGEARTMLKQMDGSGKAAEKEEEAQQELAKVRRLADNYVRLRIASLVLKKEVDRYRQENQDPILKIAGRYFSELTLGSFSDLRADIDGSGQPILVGVCPDDSTKTVQAMSSGARDQLYLALRLATLEWRFEKHEPMPFIADDILVNFDDDRATATLKALASLAERNQVILFTHHRQIVDSALALNLAKLVFVHPLSTSDVPQN